LQRKTQQLRQPRAVPENIDLMKLLFWTDLGWRNNLQRKAAFGSNKTLLLKIVAKFIKVYKPLFCAMAKKNTDKVVFHQIKSLMQVQKAYRLQLLMAK
jgi:hypothetical protein